MFQNSIVIKNRHKKFIQEVAENDPVELAIEISEALQKLNKDLDFKKFDGINDFKTQAMNILEEEE